jgi:hypothetical protein
MQGFLKPTTPIHPEDGNCNVCQNVGKLIIFDTADP